MRHFFTRGEHKEHVAMWPQGPKRVSLFMSEHTIHSSKVSESLLIIDGLREPTWPLQRNLAVKLLRIKKTPLNLKCTSTGCLYTPRHWASMYDHKAMNCLYSKYSGHWSARSHTPIRHYTETGHTSQDIVS